MTLDSLGSVSAMGGGTTYRVDSGVQVYLRSRSPEDSSVSYRQVSLSAVNAADYQLTGWVDRFGSTAGGQVRIIIAVEK